jgi:hypothetical protein
MPAREVQVAQQMKAKTLHAEQQKAERGERKGQIETW